MCKNGILGVKQGYEFILGNMFESVLPACRDKRVTATREKGKRNKGNHRRGTKQNMFQTWNCRRIAKNSLTRGIKWSSKSQERIQD